MSERDELADILEAIDGSDYMDLADAILAAGYRKPRTITTAKELDALPVGSVVRTSGDEDQFDPRVATKAAFWHNESEWFVADDSEWCLSSDELDDLPATVLYEPTA